MPCVKPVMVRFATVDGKVVVVAAPPICVHVPEPETEGNTFTCTEGNFILQTLHAGHDFDE